MYFTSYTPENRTGEAENPNDCCCSFTSVLRLGVEQAVDTLSIVAPTADCLSSQMIGICYST